MKKHLPNLLRAGCILTILSFITFSSCDNEPDPGPDTQSPSITVTPPPDNTVIKGAFNIKADVTDDRNIQTVTILVDGRVVEEVNAGTVDINIDTKQLEDGKHTIQIVAVDQEGNEQTTSFEIDVLNYFIKFVVPENFNLSNDDRLFVNTADGEFISMAPIIPGDTLKLETPDNYDQNDTYILTRFYHAEGEFDITSMYTYGEFKPGTYKLKGTPLVAHAGTANVSVSNITGNSRFTYGGGPNATANFFSTESEDSLVLRVDMNESPANVLAVAQKDIYEVPKFEFIENMDVGDLVELDYNDMFDADLMAVTVPENATGAYSVVTGLNESTNGSFLVSLYFENLLLSETKDVHYCVPGEVFDEYMFYGNYSTPSASFGHYKKAAHAPDHFPMMNANVNAFSLVDATINLDISGDADYVTLNGYLNSPSGTTSWFVLLPGSASSSVKLALPDELVNEYNIPAPDDFTFDNVNMIDLREGINGYQNYLSFLFNDDAIFVDRIFEYSEARFMMTPTGGRISTSQQPDAAAIKTRMNSMLHWGY